MKPLPLLAALLLVAAGPAAALRDNTHCLAPTRFGWADSVDSGDVDPNDDALVCMDRHDLVSTFTGNVRGDPITLAQWREEVANTGGHELAHLIGIGHDDDACGGSPAFGGCDLMNGPYDGVTKLLGPLALAKLDALGPATQVVWLDFEALSPELPADTYFSIRNTPVLSGMTLADQDLAIALVLAALEGKFATGTTTGYAGGFGLSLVTSQPAAGDYSTVSFVSLIPEPGSALLLGSGLAGLAVRRKRLRTSGFDPRPSGG
jgi:hypothetical protein